MPSQDPACSALGSGRRTRGCFETDNYSQSTGLLDTLLTASPWQPGPRSSISTSPSWCNCGLKGTPPSRPSQRAPAQEGQDRALGCDRSRRRGDSYPNSTSTALCGGDLLRSCLPPISGTSQLSPCLLGAGVVRGAHSTLPPVFPK